VNLSIARSHAFRGAAAGGAHVPPTQVHCCSHELTVHCVMPTRLALRWPQLKPVDRLRTVGTVSGVRHRGQRAGWLRAAVLGANDGIVSVASVAIGVIASGAPTSFVLTAAIAALVAGAIAMAAGEYVSVSSQRDVERADLDQERGELKSHPEVEKQELAAIYVRRGLPRELAGKVAEALTASDALGAHARDELGMAAIPARPVQRG